jgi:hypothetical protein
LFTLKKQWIPRAPPWWSYHLSNTPSFNPLNFSSWLLCVLVVWWLSQALA